MARPQEAYAPPLRGCTCIPAPLTWAPGVTQPALFPDDAVPDGPRYGVVRYKHCASGRRIAKLLRLSCSGWTEDARRAWSTASLDEATRRAAAIRGGRVRKFRR